MEARSRRIARKAAVGLVGGTVTLVGLALIPLPGPGTLVTAGGLAILGSEFETPRKVLRGARARLGRTLGSAPAEEGAAE